MNKIVKILVFCLLMGVLYACDEDKTTEDSTPFFEVVEEETNQTFGGEADAKYVSIKTNREFTVSSSDPSWCKVDIVDDKVDNLKITVIKNGTSSNRTANITVSSSGFEDITINVAQEWIASITADKSYVLITNDNLEFSLKVTASVAYDIELPEWVQQKDNSPVNGLHTFVASAIPPSERSGNIVIKATDETFTAKTTVPLVQRERIKKIGSWLFDDAQSLVKATIGENLTMVRNTAYNPNAEFLSVDGPASGNKAVRVPLNCYFLADHNMIPKVGETYISEYTLFFEFKIPVKGKFYAFYQTNLGNTDDAEIFVRSTDPATIGVGATGYNGSVIPEQWHRLYLSFKPGDVKFFLDGVQITSSTTADARFRMNLDGVILCGGTWAKKDDNEFDVAEITIWNGALGLDQIKQLEGIK